MGQFLDYLASVFTKNKLETANKEDKTDQHHQNHVTFADNSFTQAFTRTGDHDKAAKVASLSQANRRTIYAYQAIGALAFIAHVSFVTLPKVQLESFDITEPAGWQLVTLNLVPLVVYFATIGAMHEVNRPLAEGAKLSSKNTGLDLNNNDFIHSLKIVMILMILSQLSSIISDQFIWSVVMIVPLWCYLLTNRLAQAEYKRYAPSPKKQWVKLNIGGSKSPKPASPVKQPQTPKAQAKATPRTRTRRAVKDMMNNMSEKFHTLEHTFNQQVTQRLVVPLSPKRLAVE